MTPLIITGCGRSGTRYISDVLTKAGIPCTHEVTYPDALSERQLTAGTVESSWLAAPWVNGTATVIHQIRSPIHVAASWVANGYSRHASRSFRRWGIDPPDTPEKALKYWISWNDMVVPSMRWRVEDVTAEQIKRAVELSGRTVNIDAVRQALAHVPKDTNTRQGVTPAVTWADVPEGRTRDAAIELARSYGYGLA